MKNLPSWLGIESTTLDHGSQSGASDHWAMATFISLIKTLKLFMFALMDKAPKKGKYSFIHSFNHLLDSNVHAHDILLCMWLLSLWDTCS